MKEQVLNVMNDRYEALDVIEINDGSFFKNLQIVFDVFFIYFIISFFITRI